ncbi:MAG: hypothetical protein ACLFQV_13190 [Vulcanimicrobiota bacterium]
MINLMCQGCGKEVELRDDREYFSCPVCGCQWMDEAPDSDTTEFLNVFRDSMEIKRQALMENMESDELDKIDFGLLDDEHLKEIYTFTFQQLDGVKKKILIRRKWNPRKSLYKYYLNLIKKNYYSIN